MVIRYHKTPRPSSLNDGIGQGLQDCPVLSIYSSPDSLGEVSKFSVRILPNRPFHARGRGRIRTCPRHSLPRISPQARFRQQSRSSSCKGVWEFLFSRGRRWFLLCSFVPCFVPLLYHNLGGLSRGFSFFLEPQSPASTQWGSLACPVCSSP